MTARKRKLTYHTPQWLRETLVACRELTEDPPDVGALVWDAVVPAEFCVPGNKRDSMHWSAAHRLKSKCRAILQRQRPDRTTPLPGRPVVHLVRYTSHRPDPRSNWDKYPVDMLRPHSTRMTKRGIQQTGALGLIVDDSGEHIDLRAEWRSSRLGVVYVRVFTGEPVPK